MTEVNKRCQTWSRGQRLAQRRKQRKTNGKGRKEWESRWNEVRKEGRKRISVFTTGSIMEGKEKNVDRLQCLDVSSSSATGSASLCKVILYRPRWIKQKLWPPMMSFSKLGRSPDLAWQGTRPIGSEILYLTETEGSFLSLCGIRIDSKSCTKYMYGRSDIQPLRFLWSALEERALDMMTAAQHLPISRHKRLSLSDSLLIAEHYQRNLRPSVWSTYILSFFMSQNFVNWLTGKTNTNCILEDCTRYANAAAVRNIGNFLTHRRLLYLLQCTKAFSGLPI